MEDNTINLRDEFGNNVDGKILNIMEIDGIEYVVYAVSANEEEDAIYAKRVIKYANGESD